MSEAGRAAGRPGRYFAAALRFARTTGHTGIDVSAGGGRSAPRKKGANTMCGRYQFSWEESRMLARIREAVRKAGAQAPRDEVFPSDGAPVLVLREGKVVPAVMGWGFPGMQGEGMSSTPGPRRPRNGPCFVTAWPPGGVWCRPPAFMNGTRINADIFSVCPPGRSCIWRRCTACSGRGAVLHPDDAGQCQRGPGAPPYAAGAARTGGAPLAGG